LLRCLLLFAANAVRFRYFPLVCCWLFVDADNTLSIPMLPLDWCFPANGSIPMLPFVCWHECWFDSNDYSILML
jgi:hypothetical protein